MRIMAIDYGDARTGVAFSDQTGSIVGRTTVIHERNTERLLAALTELIGQEQPGQLVMGFPRNMDGSEGPRAEKSRDFKSMLEAGGSIPVTLWDERRSSIEAHAILHAAGKRERAHRRTVDAVAASLILEGYLDSIR